MILIIIACVIVGAIAIILILAASKPDVFRIERSTTARAPAEKILPFINDLRQWTAWSPFEKLDPAMKKTYRGGVSGDAIGKGATCEWDGNRKAGAGSMEIVDSSPPGKVTIKLDFIRPFEGHNIAEFTLAPSGNSTQISTQMTWAMSGPMPFPMKIFHLLFNMDKMLGKDFEAGLANLKEIAEKQAGKPVKLPI